MSRRGSRSRLPRLVDAALEVSVAGSFSRVGCAVRGRLEHWGPPAGLAGRVVIVTGASSGIGRAVALETARLGATTWVLGRDRGRTEAVARDAHARGAGGSIEPVVLDVVDADAVHSFAERIATVHDHVDVLVHAAGALFPTYRCAPDGSELTLATAVLAPFRLTGLLGPLLRRSGDANIVTVSSGGMYTERFDLGRLEMPADAYRGTTAYARAKRAQVVLSHEWARALGGGRSGELCRPPGLGGHPRPGPRPSLLRQTRSAPADPGSGGGHGGVARRRRGAPPRPGPSVDRGLLPRPAPAGRAPPAVDGSRRHPRRRPAALGVVCGPERTPLASRARGRDPRPPFDVAP